MSQEEDETSSGYVGRIPVKNLWLLMAYGSDFSITNTSKSVSVIDNPDNLPDLIAELLNLAVDKRLRRSLNSGYADRHCEIPRVRGRIDTLKTESKLLLSRGLVACDYQELTTNTPRNRYVRGALDIISKLTSKRELSRASRELSRVMEFNGVGKDVPSLTELSRDRFGRHDFADKSMVDLAKLAYQVALPSEKIGNFPIPDPSREEHWVRRLFEKAVAGFYRHSLSGESFRVKTGTPLTWPCQSLSETLKEVFPSMRADIIVDDIAQGKRLVIDTKFNQILTKGWHRQETLRSGYLYQIYAYLRTQEDSGNDMDKNAAGLLLHPSIGELLHETIELQGHRISFATLDLTQDIQQIKSALKLILTNAIHQSQLKFIAL